LTTKGYGLTGQFGRECTAVEILKNMFKKTVIFIEGLAESIISAAAHLGD